MALTTMLTVSKLNRLKYQLNLRACETLPSIPKSRYDQSGPSSSPMIVVDISPVYYHAYCKKETIEVIGTYGIFGYNEGVDWNNRDKEDFDDGTIRNNW